MKTIDVGVKLPGLDEVLEMAASDCVVIRTAEGREFFVTEIDDFDLEVARTRQNRQLLAFLEQRSKDPMRIPLAQAKRGLSIE